MSSMQNKSRFRLPDALGAEPRRRPARVADAIRIEISTLLLYQVKDPALLGVAIVRVEMSNDIKRAKIFYACDPDVEKKVHRGLIRARGFMRSHLAKVLQMKYVPELVFHSDPGLSQADRMEQIFQEIANEDKSGSD